MTGRELIGSGVAACLLIAPSLKASVRNRERTFNFRRLLMRFGLSILGYLAVIATGGMFVAGAYKPALGWLVSVAVVLLLVSLRNTWDLLVSVGDAAFKASGNTGPVA